MDRRRTKKTPSEESQHRNYFFLLLPEDLVAYILSRLTAVEIARLRCVGKSWNRFFSDRKFIHRTLFRKRNKHEEEKQGTKTPVTMITRLSSPENRYRRLLYSLLSFNTTSSLQYHDIPVNSRQSSPRSDVVGCCDGIFCIRILDVKTDLVLWNPWTSEIKLLPDPPLGTIFFFQRAYGFGFDSETGDYKVVRFSRYYEVEVYSLRNDSWRVVSRWPYLRHCPMSNIDRVHNSSCEVVYWYEFGKPKGDSSEDFSTRNYIVSYDFHKEEFDKQVFPAGLADRFGQCRGFWMVATPLEDSLVAVFRDSKGSFEIWGLFSFRKAESWTKLFRSDMSPTLGWADAFLPIGFSRNDDYVFVKDNGELFSFNFDREEFGNDHGIRVVEEKDASSLLNYGVACYTYVPSSVPIASMAKLGFC